MPATARGGRGVVLDRKQAGTDRRWSQPGEPPSPAFTAIITQENQPCIAMRIKQHIALPT